MIVEPQRELFGRLSVQRNFFKEIPRGILRLKRNIFSGRLLRIEHEGHLSTAIDMVDAGFNQQAYRIGE